MKLISVVFEKIIPVAIMALLGGLLAMYSDIGVLKVKTAKASHEISEVKNKINEIHWYLIGKKEK